MRIAATKSAEVRSKKAQERRSQIDKNTGESVGPDEINADCLAWKPTGRVNGFVVDQDGSIGVETRSGEVAYLSASGAERYKVIFNYSQIGEAR